MAQMLKFSKPLKTDLFYQTMGNRFVSFIFILFLTALFLVAVGDVGNAVPAVSNVSIIEGFVSEYAVIFSDLIGIEPRQTLYRLTINITSSYNIGEGADFLFNMTGQDVRFLSKEKLSPELFGKRIKANASYKGDERGGVFWISNIEVLQ